MTKRKFLALMGAHYESLVRVASRIRGDNGGGDTVQAVLTRLLERQGYVQVEGTAGLLRSWCFTVVCNQARNERKRATRYVDIEAAGPVDLVGNTVDACGAWTEPQVEFEELREESGVLLRTEPDLLKLDVDAALNRLSAIEQTIVQRVLIDDDPPAEVAQDLQLSASVVQFWVKVLRGYLAEQLGAYKVGKPKGKLG